MKKVLVLSVVAIAIFAVASFAVANWSGTAYEKFTYSGTTMTAAPEMWITVSGTNYFLELEFNPQNWTQFGSSYTPYFGLTLPLTKEIAVVAGYDTNMGEGTFGGSAFNGPSAEVNGVFGGYGFGYSYEDLGIQYTSSNLNVYSQLVNTPQSTNSVAQVSPVVYADYTMGPVTLYGGSESSGENYFTKFYAGAKGTVGPVALYGLYNYNSNTSNFLAEATANMGQFSFGGAYTYQPSATFWTNWQNGLPVLTNSVPWAAWVDYGSNLEANVTLNSDFTLSTVTLKGY